MTTVFMDNASTQRSARNYCKSRTAPAARSTRHLLYRSCSSWARGRSARHIRGQSSFQLAGRAPESGLTIFLPNTVQKVQSPIRGLVSFHRSRSRDYGNFGRPCAVRRTDETKWHTKPFRQPAAHDDLANNRAILCAHHQKPDKIEFNSQKAKIHIRKTVKVSSYRKNLHSPMSTVMGANNRTIMKLDKSSLTQSQKTKSS